MLPPGIVGSSQTRYQLLNSAATGQSSTQTRIISLLRTRGVLSNHQLKRALPKINWQSAMNALITQGVVERQAILKAPLANPKTVRSARLAIPPQMIPMLATTLGRESRRAAVLEVLRAAEGYFLSLVETMASAGCGEAPIRTLAETGDVRIVPKQKWVELLVPGDELQARLEAGEFERAAARQAVLQQLATTSGALLRSELEASSSVLNVLEEHGFIRIWEEMPYVELLLPPEAVLARIIELRGGQPYLDVLYLLASAPEESFSLTEIYERTGTSPAQLQSLAEDELIVFGETEVIRDPLTELDIPASLAPPLTEAQETVWQVIRQHQIQVNWQGDTPPPDVSHVFLLHGVTGSGKTEIYMRAVAEALAQGRQAIVLVPEIALTTQLSQRFAARFPGMVAIVHSELSIGERYDTWRRARAGQIQIILGARSALFTPLPDVGLIVLDEEHDDSYKQSPPVAAPYYHAREVAVEMMRRNNGTVILGSATPDVSTMFRAQRDEFTLLNLPNRVIARRDLITRQIELLNLPSARYLPTETNDAMSADLPPVEIVDMRQELRAGNRSIFSRKLYHYLHEVLANGQQAILFLNRRGSATFVMCRNCGYIARCPNCDTALTYHEQALSLLCHYCGHQMDNPMLCPNCASDRIRYFGGGTQTLDKLLREEFPQARVLRWDQDTANQKGAHQRILKTFMDKAADILVGTQMIAKGLDIPLVTLVGIVSGDTALGLPDYRTNERSFQLLTQVAGRAGRGLLKGRVVLQTYKPDHYAIQAASRHDYQAFYAQEIEYRQTLGFPPFTQLARLLFHHKQPDEAQKKAEEMAKILRQHQEGGAFVTTEIVGPTPCFYLRREGVYRWQILIRSENIIYFLRDVELPTDLVLDIHPTDLL
jgi:primosomal protein N' (replication factor Y)